MTEVPVLFNFARDVFDRWACQQPDALALWHINAADGKERQFTFAQMRDLSQRAARVFHDGGLRAGSTALVMLPRIPEWWIAMLGLVRLGVVPVPCTPLLTARDLAYRVEMARIAGIITDSESTLKLSGYEGARWGIGDCPTGWCDFGESLRRAEPGFEPPHTRSDDPGMLYFTSATTGSPKMVLHTQASYGLAHKVTGSWWLDLRPADIHWNVADLGWGKAAWSSFFGPWHQGACVFVLDTHGRFSPSVTLDTLAAFPITSCCAPPTALRMLVREDLGRYQFKHLRHTVTAGEPLNPAVFDTWKSSTGLTLYEAYGQTETVVLIGNSRSSKYPVCPGSMGHVAPGYHVELLDEYLDPVPVGQEGEVAIRIHPERPLGLCREYLRNPEENARQFRNGWYLTGDRALRDADGYHWFIGRKDDVIKSSGYRIGPFEVESALLSHGAVLEAGVIGKADETRGQIVKAFVVLRTGYTPGDQLKIDLQRHCKETSAPYKYPREIEFVSELPKTISGKTRHVELRRREANNGSS